MSKCGSTMLWLIPKYHTCGQTKERTPPLLKALDVSEGNFRSSSRMGTCEYTKVFPDCEQSSIHCFLPAVCGELPRSKVFNQLANQLFQSVKKGEQIGDGTCSLCLASIGASSEDKSERMAYIIQDRKNPKR